MEARKARPVTTITTDFTRFLQRNRSGYLSSPLAMAAPFRRLIPHPEIFRPNGAEVKDLQPEPPQRRFDGLRTCKRNGSALVFARNFICRRTGSSSPEWSAGRNVAARRLKTISRLTPISAAIAGIGLLSCCLTMAAFGCRSAFIDPSESRITGSGADGDADEAATEDEGDQDDETSPETDAELEESIEYHLKIEPFFTERGQSGTLRVEFENRDELLAKYGIEDGDNDVELDILASRLDFGPEIFIRLAEFQADEMAFDPVKIFVNPPAAEGVRIVTAEIRINGRLVREYGRFFIPYSTGDAVGEAVPSFNEGPPSDEKSNPGQSIYTIFH